MKRPRPQEPYIPGGTARQYPGRPAARFDLKWEIALVLLVKAIAIGIIWTTWFSNPQGKRLGGEDIGRAVYAVAPPTTSQEEANDATRHGPR